MNKHDLTKIVSRRHNIMKATRDFLYSRDFIEVSPTRITNISGACEDFYTLMDLDFYGNKAYLSQTAQPLLENHLQYYDKVFTIGQCYRKESKFSYRHLSEFLHIEAELVISSLSDLLVLVNDYMNYLAKQCNLVEKITNIESITYTEASKLLVKNNFNHVHGDEFSSEQERFIASQYNGIIFITNYPKHHKIFNFKESSDSYFVENADLIVENVGEIMSIGIREKDYKKIKTNMINSKVYKELNSTLNLDRNYEWYINMKKDSDTYSGGFSIGMERLLMYLYNLDDIINAVEIPRNNKNTFLL